MSKIYKLPLIMAPQPEEGYVVTCPLIPELITEGETVNDAITNANDALEAVIDSFDESGKPLPASIFQEQTDAQFWLETILTVP